MTFAMSDVSDMARSKVIHARCPTSCSQSYRERLVRRAVCFAKRYKSQLLEGMWRAIASSSAEAFEAEAQE